jgi:predicted phosphodiesterase
VQFLILSDIHANWPALQSVLADAEGIWQKAVCCGDLVGYNPNPDRVTAWVREHCVAVIRGNHDKVVAGIDSLEWFNEVAQMAARWTMGHMAEPQRQFLRDLPIGPVRTQHFHIWHGSVADEDEYVSTAREAAPHFEQFDVPLAFFGHTHLQGGFALKRNRVAVLARVEAEEHERVIELDPDSLYMINPGSVGQPRDGDPRAAYALYDSERKLVTLRRVEYPIEMTATEIAAAGLPEVLGLRLFHGM